MNRQESEEELGERHQIRFDEANQEVVLSNFNKQLCYLMLSTEPGRKIYHPPRAVEHELRFPVERCDGIEEDLESFCAIGLANCLTEVGEVVEKKSSSKVVNKSVYISKVKVGFKAVSCEGRNNGDKKDKTFLKVYPPTDLGAHEIQPILQDFQSKFGPAATIDTKRNCLILSYSEQISIHSHFIISKLRANQNEVQFTYYSITSHRTLFTFEPKQLIQLPSGSSLSHLVIHKDWAICSTSSDVLLLHLYRPLQLFLTVTDLKPQAILPLGNDRILIFEYKYIHCYQLFSHKNPIHLGRGKIKKMQPFSMAIKKKTAIVGGTNFSYMMNEPTADKQLYVIDNFTTSNFQNKTFLADRTFQLCKKNEHDPVLNLTYISDLDVFFCSCQNTVYIFHLETEYIVASVELNGPVEKIYEVSYPINLINCLVKLKGFKTLIRVSFEKHCEIMGTEVSLCQNFGQPNDFMVSVGKSKSIYVCDGDLIIGHVNERNSVLFSSEQKSVIDKIYCNEEALVFSVCTEQSVQIFFLQI